MTQFLQRGVEITVKWNGSSLVFPVLHHNVLKEVAEYFSSLMLSEFPASVILGSIMWVSLFSHTFNTVWRPSVKQFRLNHYKTMPALWSVQVEPTIPKNLKWNYPVVLQQLTITFHQNYFALFLFAIKHRRSHCCITFYDIREFFQTYNQFLVC